MIKYKKVYIESLNDDVVDKLYKNLLEEKWQFIIMEKNYKKYALTKEKSIFEIIDEAKFIDEANRDIYYHTEYTFEEINLENRLDVFKEYIKKYENKIVKRLYGDKYIFGSVAVRVNENSFITTIRGKEDLSEYTIVSCVNNKTHIVYVKGKKATLNAPLLAHLFENEEVDAIVHINHYFESNLKDDDYAFPGTVRDSLRDNRESFNIRYHGVIYLFDKNGKML